MFNCTIGSWEYSSVAHNIVAADVHKLLLDGRNHLGVLLV